MGFLRSQVWTTGFEEMRAEKRKDLHGGILAKMKDVEREIHLDALDFLHRPFFVRLALWRLLVDSAPRWNPGLVPGSRSRSGLSMSVTFSPGARFVSSWSVSIHASPYNNLTHHSALALPTEPHLGGFVGIT